MLQQALVLATQRAPELRFHEAIGQHLADELFLFLVGFRLVLRHRRIDELGLVLDRVHKGRDGVNQLVVQLGLLGSKLVGQFVAEDRQVRPVAAMVAQEDNPAGSYPSEESVFLARGVVQTDAHSEPLDF